jgi:adenylate cyclase
MSPAVELLIYEKTAVDRAPQLVATVPLRGRTELGRQEATTESLYGCTWQDAERCWRVVIARGTEQTIGRHHAMIEPLPDGRVLLTNTSTRSTVQIENGPSLSQSTPSPVELPAGGLVVRLGSSRVVRLQHRNDAEADLGELPQKTVPPEEFSRLSLTSSRLPLPADPGIDSEALIGWLQMALGLLQSAANSPDFFPRAAQAVVDLAGMDSGRVLLLEKGGWQEKARAFQDGAAAAAEGMWRPGQRILDRVHADRKTFWELPRLGSMGSMLGVQAVVAAPILDQKSEVIGVLYGDRRQVGRPITRIEAMLVELLACGVASRLARLKEEQAALRFEQFFTPQLARHLAVQPDLLDGRIASVTILFCDVRGFARFSHRLSPADTVKWISDVMAELSDCVIEHQGVLVDYVGDELMAMWGAPEQQANHAQLACQAALDMLAKLPDLNKRWQATLGEPMSFGIGLNSGEAHVGNTGSPRKFKYGPLGNTVNLASRVQGATKHLKTRLLITKNTFGQLDLALQGRARRLCLVKVIGIDDPVELYELAVPNQVAWPDWKEKYEEALAYFDRMNFRLAARTLLPLSTEEANDAAAIVLLSRAVQGMANGPAPGHPVWELPTK